MTATVAALRLAILTEPTAELALVDLFDAAEQLAGGPGRLVHDPSTVSLRDPDGASETWTVTAAGTAPDGTRERLAALTPVGRHGGRGGVVRLAVRVHAGARFSLDDLLTAMQDRLGADRLVAETAVQSPLNGGTRWSGEHFWRLRASA